MNEDNCTTVQDISKKVRPVFKNLVSKLNTIPLCSSEHESMKTKTDIVDIDAVPNGFEIRLKTYELKIGGEEDNDGNDWILEYALIAKLSELVNSDGRFQIIDSYGSEKGYWYFLVKYV